MPIKTVTKLALRTIEKITEITCDKCGLLVEGFPGYHHLEVEGDYDTSFPSDQVSVSLVVCCPCLKAWVDTFKQDPEPALAQRAVYPELGATGRSYSITYSGVVYPSDQECPVVVWWPKPPMLPYNYKHCVYQFPASGDLFQIVSSHVDVQDRACLLVSRLPFEHDPNPVYGQFIVFVDTCEGGEVDLSAFAPRRSF